MSEWQPIETAPKDGRRILIYRNSHQESFTVGWWSDEWNAWMTVPGSWEWGPTHWLPIPAPPRIRFGAA